MKHKIKHEYNFLLQNEIKNQIRDQINKCTDSFFLKRFDLMTKSEFFD